MERAFRQYVFGGMFGTFALQTAIGRRMRESDDLHPGAHPYAVLSYDYWARRFARDRNVIGRTFRSGNDLFEIIGVSSEPFTGTETGIVTDIFLPMSMKNPATLASPNNFWMRALFVLKPD